MLIGLSKMWGLDKKVQSLITENLQEKRKAEEKLCLSIMKSRRIYWKEVLRQ
jgi:hypothetical protein